jgi:threonine dehydratase
MASPPRLWAANTFPILQALLTGIVPVPERDIARALSLILTRAKQVVEPTGALTTAAALYGHLPPGTLTDKQVVSLLCGGNLDLAQLPKLLDLVD